MRVDDADGAVAGLAASQHGAITRLQAASVGMTTKMVRSRKAAGMLAEPYPGVLVLNSTPPSWRRQLMVALLAGGERTVVAFESAAALHGLDGFDEGPVTICVPRGHRRPSLPEVRVGQAAALERCDRWVIDGIAVTGLARTLADLGSVVPPDRVQQALDDARRRGASLQWLRQTAERLHRPGQAGTGLLLAKLDRIRPGERVPDSWFEVLIERCVASPLLPDLVRQHEVFDDSGNLIGRVDLASPRIKLGIEGHSREHHYGSAEAFDEDRDLDMAAAGWELLYIGWQGTKQPAKLLAIVEAVARRRLAIMKWDAHTP